MTAYLLFKVFFKLTTLLFSSSEREFWMFDGYRNDLRSSAMYDNSINYPDFFYSYHKSAFL